MITSLLLRPKLKKSIENDAANNQNDDDDDDDNFRFEIAENEEAIHEWY